jgi:hypothetical protein
MQRKRIIAATLWWVIAAGHASAAPQSPANPSSPKSVPPSLSLSPAVIMVRAQPGASSTHPLTISNLTYSKLRFVLEAFDVVVRDEKRVSVPAGETEGGIARSAIFDPATIELNPGESRQVKVTLTVPEAPSVRAVIALFLGQTQVASDGAGLAITGSLGTLITYNLSSKVALSVAQPTVALQTDTSNLTVSEQLKNTGAEPVIPKGTLAILDERSGRLVGRVAIEPHRLLPGEKFDCAVEYSNGLKSGHYRAMTSFEDEGEVQTSSVTFEIP